MAAPLGLVRRFHMGLASDLAESKVRSMTGAVLALLDGEDGVVGEGL